MDVILSHVGVNVMVELTGHLTNIKNFFKILRKHQKFHATFVAFILYLQIPHMLWAYGCVSGTDILNAGNPVINFILYGIDLLEIPGVIVYSLGYIAILLNKHTKCEACFELIEKDQRYCSNCGWKR